MKRFVRWAVDSIVIYAAATLVYEQHGLAWAIAAAAAAGAYGLWCFWDGVGVGSA